MQITATDSNRVIDILRSFDVKRAGLFGSQARHDTHAGSDLDLLVEMQDSASLFDLIRLKHTLEDTLHISVDLVEYAALKPVLRADILNEEIRLI